MNVNGFEIIKLFFRQAEALRYKTTTMNPLQWIIIILLISIVSLFMCGAPIWIIILLAFFLAISLLLYLCAYIYFMRTDPESLRTEEFIIRKKEIEKGFFGDNKTGLIDPAEQPTKSINSNKSDAEVNK